MAFQSDIYRDPNDPSQSKLYYKTDQNSGYTYINDTNELQQLAKAGKVKVGSPYLSMPGGSQPTQNPTSPQMVTPPQQPFTPTVTSPTNIVGGSSNLRDQESQTKAQGANVIGNLNAYGNLSDQINKSITGLFGQIQNATPYEQSDEYKQNQSLIDKARAALGTFTPDEQAQIDQQATAAGAAFDPLIQQAQSQKAKGEGISLVNAGQSGGLMNSQVAGQAATSQTQGGDFFGAGGKLEDVRSAYDSNISQLQASKTQAIQAARAAAQEAIRTGKQQNLQQAQDLFQQAQQANDRANQMAQEKIQVLQQLGTMQKSYLSDAQTQATNIANGLLDLDEQGNVTKPTDEDLQQLAQQQGVDFYTLKSSVNSRYDQLQQMSLDQRKDQADLNKTLGVTGSGGSSANNLEFHAATKYQPAGYFNKATGEFTPLNGKSSSTTTSGGSTVSRSVGGSGGGSSLRVNTSNNTNPTLNKLTQKYPPEFQSYIQSIAPNAKFDLNSQSINDLYKQYNDLKGKGVLPTLSPLSGDQLDSTQLPPHIPAGKDVGGYSAEAIDLLAKNFHDTGQMPGLGTSKAAQSVRAAVTNRAALLFSDQPGSQAVKYNNKALGSALMDQTKYANATERSVKNADTAFKQLISTFDKAGINTSQSAIANKWVNDFKRNLSGGDQRAFDASLQEVANEYSQVFSRGGQPSEATRADAQRILSGNISITDLKKIQAQLQAQGEIVIKGAKDQVKSIQNQLNGESSNDSSDSGSGDVESYKDKYGLDY